MKHLLTAALIATALASPVRASEVTLNCRQNNAVTAPLDFRLIVDTVTWSAQYESNNHTMDAETLAVDDEYAIWAIMFYYPNISAFILHLDRENLRLMFSSIDAENFHWFDLGLDLSPWHFQCSNGI